MNFRISNFDFRLGKGRVARSLRKLPLPEVTVDELIGAAHGALIENRKSKFEN
jgi:hypothetical protein